MSNWITHYGKMQRQMILLFLCFWLIKPAVAESVTINVYLQLNTDNKIAEIIKEFNQFLADKEILTTYQITPFIEKYPLHVTLYMASYPEKQIANIIKRAETVAKQYKKISLLGSTIISYNNGYVELSVTNSPQTQSLSNKVFTSLYQLRDKKASIPAWAARDIRRKELFNQYGSPSVLDFFQPHFSILSAEHLNKFDVARLCEQLKKLIPEFDANHLIQVRSAVTGIGVGIANEQGQIVKELALFPLS